MKEALNVLEHAISDVGSWTWWAEKLPDIFQIEFIGVQLWNPPTGEGEPPSSHIALGFIKPSVVAFLTESHAADLDPGWPTAMHEDRLEPFGVHYDQFTLTSDEQIAAMTSDCSLQFLVGGTQELQGRQDPIRLGFRAGRVGLIVSAQRMRVLSSRGEMTPEQIVEASSAWWSYWREYWQRRGTDSPMPEDWTCEVTIPLKNG